jgi:hypothetical protein
MCGRQPAPLTEARATALNSKVAARIALLLMFGLLLAGCDHGPPMGTVKGTVTLDGQPVDGGVITFVPSDGNSQPEAVPITAGAYSVTMPVGDKRVEIYWAPSGGQVGDTATQGREQIVQRVPAKYNAQSTLTHTVAKGEARKDFPLTK